MTGKKDFYIGSPATRYGQALVRPDDVGADAPVLAVETIMLSDLLRRLRQVDLIDMDIQGAELEVLSEAEPQLARARRVYIETHSHAVHDQLRALFARADGDWSPVVDVPLGAQWLTPLGRASFADGGVQLWLNETPATR
jgi:hypothetical protein